MSNVEDSSSLEYLDESQYLEEDDHYTQFLLPPVPPQRQQSKTLHHFGPGSGPHPSAYNSSGVADVIVEPEYTEADPGLSGTYRSLPDGPTASGPAPPSSLMHSGSSSSLRPRPKESMIHPSSSLYSPVMDRAGVSDIYPHFRTTRSHIQPFISTQPFGMEGFRQSVESTTAPSKTSPLQRSSSTVISN